MPKKALSARMRYSTFERDFKPVKNHLGTHGTMDGFGFETYGQEMDHVLATHRAEPERVWTVVEGDNGKWYITNGIHYVNRVVYLITEKPCDRPVVDILYA